MQPLIKSNYLKTRALLLTNLPHNKKYLLAVSGGLDSMVMTDLFLKQKIEFAVAHCNFGLRGGESDGDEEFIRHWCRQNQIPLFVRRFDTLLYADTEKLSIQEAARNLRYTYFYEMLEKENYDYIATAHHQDDNIETVLFHFFRGSGLQGLTGIPFQNNKIIRPLLAVSRMEIYAYANEKQIAFREDSSNLKQDYTRNKLRHGIIPQLESIFPTFKKNIAQNISRLQDANFLYQAQISSLKEKIIEKRGADFYIPLLKLKNMPVLQTLVYEVLKPFGFSFSQSLQVLDLLNRQTGTLVQNETHRVIRNRNFLIITPMNSLQSEMILIEKEIREIATPDFKLHFKLTTTYTDNAPDPNFCQLNAALLEYPLLLRKWRQGDYLYPLGMPKKKKVSRVLIDAKIPLHEKEKIWVLESDKKIVWIAGIKMDNRYKVNPDTKEILQLKLTTP